ncbi:MAG: phosphoenolpyruvate synthase, partial [Deltaproteobacteria bacterium]|nr:phosphoenolpyruvate synthase [Deltaproteobacteria bacterium]
QGTLENVVSTKLSALEADLTKIVSEQMATGTVSLDIKLRSYVGIVTGLAHKMEELTEREGAKGTDEVLAIHRQLRELDKKLDEHLEFATQRFEVLKTSHCLKDHVAVIMGYADELENLGIDSQSQRRRLEIQDSIAATVARIAQQPVITETLAKISALREDVAKKVGLQQEMEAVRTLPRKIEEILKSRGYRSGKELYIQSLAQGLALFAMAFHSKTIVYRTTDYKTNEYRNLLGGLLFEGVEDNPMLGYRGVSRNIHDWELEAFKLARGAFGGVNLHLMLPFVRTLEEARSQKRYLEQVHNIHSGDNGLKLILMSEIPSNAVLAKEFLREFDGFSIGSNDMTQLVLGTDRDNARLRHIYDEEDPAVVWAILTTIFTGQKFGKKVGFCGQGVSNSKIIRGLVCIAGIVSASVVPDTYQQTKLDVAEVESENITLSGLGAWLKEQHLDRLHMLLAENRYEHILKKNTSASDLMEWYEGELARLHEQMQSNLGSAKEEFYRQELASFRAIFHKPVIYANWEWETTVLDALHQAGFASYDEQAQALEAQRSHSW